MLHALIIDTREGGKGRIDNGIYAVCVCVSVYTEEAQFNPRQECNYAAGPAARRALRAREREKVAFRMIKRRVGAAMPTTTTSLL